MLNKIKSYLLFGNRFSGIEHTFKNGKDAIIISTLRQSKNELNLESSQINTIEENALKNLKNKHAVLVINNEKVLSKTVISKQQDTLKIVHGAFPNINLDDFYFEVLSENDNHFVSLSRKDYVDAIVESYQKLKVSIIDISLGNNLVNTVNAFVSYNKIKTSNAIVKIEDNKIIQIEKSKVEKEVYNINGIDVSSYNLLSFSGALHCVLNKSNTATNFEARKELLLNNYKHSHFFSQFLKLGGIFILGMLLINFFVFNHYFEKVKDLQQVSEINQSSKQKILLLNETVSKKQKMVNDLLKSNGSKSSFYSSEIIKSLPKTVLLSEFNYQPLQKRIKAGKEIAIAENNILISGKSNDSKLFSSWISQIEQKNWIEKVDIIDYGSASTAFSDFKIKVTIAND